jgi:hypothetical protein
MQLPIRTPSLVIDTRDNTVEALSESFFDNIRNKGDISDRTRYCFTCMILS